MQLGWLAGSAAKTKGRDRCLARRWAHLANSADLPNLCANLKVLNFHGSKSSQWKRTASATRTATNLLCGHEGQRK